MIRVLSSTLLLTTSVCVIGAAEAPAANPANEFADPSFEQAAPTEGKSGQIYVFFEGTPLWDNSGTKAHSGKAAVGLPGIDAKGKQVFFQMSGALTPGKPFQLKGFFRCEKAGGSLHLQVNSDPVNGSTKVFENNHSISTDWQEKALSFTVPADAKSEAILIIRGGTPDNPVWMDDVFFGEVK